MNYQEKEFPGQNFSKRFSDLLVESGLTQKDLARALEIAESAVVNYKSGRIPSAEVLYRIARHFNISMEWLLLGKGYRTVEAHVEAVLDHMEKMDPALSDPTYRAKIVAEITDRVKSGDDAFLARGLEAQLASMKRKHERIRAALQRVMDEL